MKKISFVSPCYNEEENISEIYNQIKNEMSHFPQYTYEIIFIDNASTDKTVDILKSLARSDRKVKVIINSRNFGQVRSPYYGALQASGDAFVMIAADLQDPPTLIKAFIKKWEEGYQVIKAVKINTKESWWMAFTRKRFYSLINRLSDIYLTPHYYGYGLYDKVVLEALKKMDDPYPYFRGLISDVGFKSVEILFEKPARKKGVTKNNFYRLYNVAMLGIVSYSKIPLRFATMFGFLMSGISLLIAIIYFVLKILFWRHFPMGTAPLIIAIFFFASIQLFFIGILGEYIGFIYTQVQKRPLVIEKERINFD